MDPMLIILYLVLGLLCVCLVACALGIIVVFAVHLWLMYKYLFREEP